jgi:hypothetical protein
MDDGKNRSRLTRRSFLQLGAAATAAGLLQERPLAAAATSAVSPKR